jgi:hypothetical protein
LLFFFFFIYNTVHDPNISGPVDCPSWLPAATGNTNAQILIDRLAAQRVSIIFQKNFLIPQSIWENCRNEGSANSEWMDTYYLVCNYGIHSFLGRHVPSVRPIEKISHLQKLCMVHRIRSSEQVSSQLYRDYVFAPTHSIQSELCMILQTCYFYLPRIQYTSVSQVPAEAVVRQISLDEYREHTTPWSSSYIHAEQGNFVIVHEVAFAPKGQHDSNLSFWFNTPAIKLEASQIKRSRCPKQKKKAQIRVSPNNASCGLYSSWRLIGVALLCLLLLDQSCLSSTRNSIVVSASPSTYTDSKSQFDGMEASGNNGMTSPVNVDHIKARAEAFIWAAAFMESFNRKMCLNDAEEIVEEEAAILESFNMKEKSFDG